MALRLLRVNHVDSAMSSLRPLLLQERRKSGRAGRSESGQMQTFGTEALLQPERLVRKADIPSPLDQPVGAGKPRSAFRGAP